MGDVSDDDFVDANQVMDELTKAAGSPDGARPGLPTLGLWQRPGS
jgi:hypothetical protein